MSNDIELTPEEKALFDELYELEQQQKEKFKTALQYFKEHGLYDGDFSLVDEFFEDLSSYTHVGYVNVERRPEIKPGYGRSSSDNTFYRIKADMFSQSLDERLLHMTFGKCYEEGDDGDRLEYLVYQYEEFEDSYVGYLLFPLKDGHYWLLHYSI